jgi:type VI secretion system secreted protein VgrG
MSYTQENRRIAISTPLGQDTLLLRGFTGSEAISQLFHFDLDLLSENESIKFQDLVGKNITLRIFDADGAERHWNGFISRFSQGSQDRRLAEYRAQMVPWLWFLTRTSDCRIFQNQTAPDIIQKVFKDLGFQDFELRLYGDFTPREYCVQYRETDFNFVSRLMEEEGIFYYFRHEEKKHVLILANDPAAHDPCPGQESARYDFRGGAITYEDVVTEWYYQEEFRTGAWAQTDYNFETPSTSLAVTVAGKNPFEIYEYPGEYRARAEGDNLARIRLQEQTVPCMVSHGGSGCRHFCSGFQFALTDHYRKDLNQDYLLTAVRHVASQQDYGTGSEGGDELSYRNSFECIPVSTPYRPPRVTPQPFIQGCQTAVVVGPSGEEIHTDKYGRVKVQFHWDREGKRDENSSCWIRVSHPWAGQGYGSVSIPRIGQEVIVDFLEGDPDQPIIIGRVYNAEQMPPNGLPSAGMVSGCKSNSTPGGGGYNEMSMDDTKGKEKITVHAQYDMSTTVEHDNTNKVVNDEKTDITGNRTETVTKKETITIIGGREETVSAGEKITITGGRTENVTGTEKITITGNRDETVTSGEKITITGGRTENVTGTEKITITGARDETVTAGETVKITGATNHNITGPLEITATASMKLKVGGSTVTILPGSIEISSAEIKVNGGSIQSTAEGSHKIGGASITISGGSINSSASGTHEIVGGMVKIN